MVRLSDVSSTDHDTPDCIKQQVKCKRRSTTYDIEIEQVTDGSPSASAGRMRAVLRPRSHYAECTAESDDDYPTADVRSADALNAQIDDDGAAFTDEEIFLFRRTTKADRRAGTAGGGSGRARAVNKRARRKERSERRDNAKPRRARRFRRREKREEERAVQLEARKGRTRAALGFGGGNDCWAERLDLSAPPPSDNFRFPAFKVRPPVGNKRGKEGRPARRRQQRYAPNGRSVEILSAEELGIESKAMYNRLLRILDGEEITPEDFDLLLQLDSKNAKSTMEASKVSEFAELLVVGPESDGAADGGAAGRSPTTIQRDNLKGRECIICLAQFENLSDGSQLRRLPCQHMYCRDCIDQWLTKNSARCPDLSCFWSMAKTIEET